jgi:hypothetical protein
MLINYCCLFLLMCYSIGEMLAKEFRGLMMTPRVLRPVPTMTIGHRRGMPRLTEALPEIRVMTVLMV